MSELVLSAEHDLEFPELLRVIFIPGYTVGIESGFGYETVVMVDCLLSPDLL